MGRNEDVCKQTLYDLAHMKQFQEKDCNFPLQRSLAHIVGIWMEFDDMGQDYYKGEKCSRKWMKKVTKEFSHISLWCRNRVECKQGRTQDFFWGRGVFKSLPSFWISFRIMTFRLVLFLKKIGGWTRKQPFDTTLGYESRVCRQMCMCKTFDVEKSGKRPKIYNFLFSEDLASIHTRHSRGVARLGECSGVKNFTSLENSLSC